jgi:hypothetical protein
MIRPKIKTISNDINKTKPKPNIINHQFYRHDNRLLLFLVVVVVKYQPNNVNIEVLRKK